MAEITMQPNPEYDVYDEDDLDPRQEEAYTLGDDASKPTVFVLVAKNIVIFSSAAIMIFFIVIIVDYIF